MPGKRGGKKRLSQGKKEKMDAILSDLRARMKEIDEMGERIQRSGQAPAPRKTQHLLEEIKVPPLKILKEES